MSLRTKIVLTLVGVFLGAGVVSVLVNEKIILPNFAALEHDEADKNTHRVIEALNQEVQGLASTVSTWGWWDDTYQYVQDGNADFADTNLTPQAVAGPQVSYIAVYDLNGTLIGSGSAATELGENLYVGELADVRLPKDHPLLLHTGPRSGAGGLIAGTPSPLIAVSWPIQKTNGEGPTQGSVMMVRPLNQLVLERLASHTKLKFTLTAAAPSVMSYHPVDRHDEGLVVGHLPIRIKTEAKQIVGVTELTDVHGQPLLQLKVYTPRDITARGLTAVNYALFILSGAALLLFALLLGVLQRTLFRPLARLTAHVVALGNESDLTMRMNLRRRDELGTLANVFDRMTERLAEARHHLAEQSFDSGRADMASGILHNLGNAITPLSVRLTKIKADLHAAPLDHLERALAELASEGTPGERRANLDKFLHLGASELVRILRATAEGLEISTSQLGHAQQILSDQERFSRSRQRVEAVNLLKVIEQSYADLSPDLQASMALQIQADVAQIGLVVGSWVAIRQVVSNLMINAAESLSAQGKLAGQLHVRCKLESNNDGVFVHTIFTDNGSGIPSEQLPKIFMSGYSTKQRGSGTGLHWCANAVNAMQGRIYAESKGTGLGAVFHLILPADVDSLRTAAAG